MNKKLISVAVAAAFAAPMAASADTTLYGKVNNSLVYNDASISAWEEDGVGAERSTFSTSGDNWDVEDYASRIGVKGSEDLGNGMKAIYQIELQMETADGGSTSRPPDGFGTRLGFVGLTGGFGTFAIGRQWTPYYGSVDKTDIFPMDLTNDAYMGATRTGNAVAYVSPNMSGFTVSGALVMTDDLIADDDADLGYKQSDDLDAFNLSADYNNGPISVGASYFSNENANTDQWGIAGSYSFGMFKVIGQYEDGDVSLASAASGALSGLGILDSDTLDAIDELYVDGLPKGDGSAWAIAGQATFGNNVIGLKYGERDADGRSTYSDLGVTTTSMDLEEWVLSWEHNLSKRTKVFAVYDHTESSVSHQDKYDGVVEYKGNADLESDRFGLGIQHLF